VLRERFAAALGRAGGRMVAAGDAGAWVLENADEETGVDRADLLIAETGTVVRTFESRESSRASLGRSRSVFLATEELLVADLPAALRVLEERHAAGRAYTLLITGPSRTADIEKEPVVPAHGPRELVVVVETEQV
ncbi:MAG: hypothetical protein GF328_06005, partial [Candidatus Latescibacteria bacterium]|nr:hypothetical protein [Candidatus Latescibacterota bacterium]